MYLIYKPAILFLVCTLEKLQSTQDTCTRVFIAWLTIEKNVEGTAFNLLTNNKLYSYTYSYNGALHRSEDAWKGTTYINVYEFYKQFFLEKCMFQRTYIISSTFFKFQNIQSNIAMSL